MKIENAKKFREEREEGEFVKRMNREIGAVYGVAVNQGFWIKVQLYFFINIKIIKTIDFL